MTFDNTSKKNWSTTENRSAEFVAFIRALLWRLLAAAPQAKASWGLSPIRWAVETVLGGAVLAFLVVTFVQLFWSGLHWAVRLLFLAAIPTLLWSAWVDFKRNGPRAKRIDELANFLDEPT